MARRLMRQKHEVVVYDRSTETTRALAKEGATGAKDYAELVKNLNPPMRNKFGGHVESLPIK